MYIIYCVSRWDLFFMFEACRTSMPQSCRCNGPCEKDACRTRKALEASKSPLVTANRSGVDMPYISWWGFITRREHNNQNFVARQISSRRTGLGKKEQVSVRLVWEDY